MNYYRNNNSKIKNETIDNNIYAKSIYKKIKKFRISSPEHKPYLVTFMFRVSHHNRHNISQNKYLNLFDPIWADYDRTYVSICSKLDKYYARKYPLLPVTAEFIDYSGTSKNNFAEYKSLYTPHIHAIYLIHPDTNERFERLMKPVKIKTSQNPTSAERAYQQLMMPYEYRKIVHSPALECLESIHAAPIAPTEKDFHDTFFYAAKFFTSKPACTDPLLIETRLNSTNPIPKKELPKYQRLTT